MLQEYYNEVLVKESLKRRITAAGHNPRSFANEIGMPPETLARLLSDKHSFNPTLQTILAIANGLDITLDELLLFDHRSSR